MDLKEGDVVVVTGKLDDRVRHSDAPGLVFGTLISIHGSTASVFLDNGDLWYGPIYQIQLASLQAPT